VKVAAGSLQRPGSAVSVEPTMVSPSMRGRVMIVGAAGRTTAVGAENAVFAPLPFVAVTATRRELPRSSAERV
jgi:hypothetical protein